MDNDDLYQSPLANALLEVEHLDAQGLRERYSRGEVAVMAVGWFYYFFGSLLAGIGACLLVGYLLVSELIYIVPAAVCLIMGPVYVITGYGLRRFDLWARVPSMFAALVAVVIPPAGTLAGAVSFFLLKQHASKEMFTARYQTAIISDGDISRHFGWLGVVGGLLSGVTLSIIVYLIIKGVF